MNKDARILYVFPSENESCKTFVHSLKEALSGWKIAVSDAKLTTLLFRMRGFDLVHLFLPAAARSAQLLAKLRGKTKLIQTIVSPPDSPEAYKNAIFGDHVVVFSEHEKRTIERIVSNAQVQVIPPCLSLPDPSTLSPSSQVREKYSVGERMMVVALSDISSRKHFDAFLYVVREYNRREAFCFLIPQYNKDRETALWRRRLQESIALEKLDSTCVLDEPVDLHSLLDAADMAIYFERNRDHHFDFPLPALEAAYLGKPVLCFDVSPFNEVMQLFRPQWVVQNPEDFVRETRDIKKEEARLEQISTELARFARTRYGVETVASLHQNLYRHLLA